MGLADEEEEYLTVHVVLGVDYFFRMLGSSIVRADDDDPVMSAVVSVFDRLGCLAPYTVRAKIIIQLQWQVWSTMPRAGSLVPPRNLITLKSRLQFFTEELEQLCADSAATGMIKTQLAATEEIYRRFDLLQEEYGAGLDGEEVKTAMAEWAECRKGFRGITVRARSLISAGKIAVPRASYVQGGVTAFRGFWDRFADSIHKRMDLSDAAKLSYLRGCLTGDALRSIIGLSSSNADYEVAVQRVKERFDRPYIAVRKLVLE
ncbi:hypothetical protein T03_2707 [Trichinella britovi]|uniref:Uncharacterized protein n=1 Tax=Trichinella britovi TaxID=45882 RepID=A0A0V1CDZ3_TRIBR|nr:hypothetical protein T03_2707 [Trichinella britovi]